MLPLLNGCANNGTFSGQLDSAPASGRMLLTANITCATLRMTVPGRTERLTVTWNVKLTSAAAPGRDGRAVMTVEVPSRSTLMAVPAAPRASPR
jgi:hypothetical protein